MASLKKQVIIAQFFGCNTRKIGLEEVSQGRHVDHAPSLDNTSSGRKQRPEKPGYWTDNAPSDAPTVSFRRIVGR
ncbi:hypothetical protein [Megalodesulfovibrio paquesii]|jgi:hypothetical protein